MMILAIGFIIIDLTYHYSSSSDEDTCEISITKTKPQYVRTCASELYYRRDEQVRANHILLINLYNIDLLESSFNSCNTEIKRSLYKVSL